LLHPRKVIVLAALAALALSHSPALGLTFQQHVVDSSFARAFWVHAADVDQDGHMDILGAARLGADFAWWENDGTQSFTEHVISSFFKDVAWIELSDLDQDGDLDVLGAAYADLQIAWWENDGTPSFSKHVITSTFDGAYGVSAADFDGDGDLDVVGAAHLDDAIAWWENDGTENFPSVYVIAWEFNGARHVFPVDLDDDMDILAGANEGASPGGKTRVAPFAATGSSSGGGEKSVRLALATSAGRLGSVLTVSAFPRILL
jgi:uncharacterized protein (DUF952 family)